MCALLPGLHPPCVLVSLYTLIQTLSSGKQELQLKSFSVILAGGALFLFFSFLFKLMVEVGGPSTLWVVPSLGRQLCKKAGSANTSHH